MRNPDERRFLDAARHIETAEIPLFEIGPDMALARQILENFYAMRDAVHAYRFTRPTGALPSAAPANHPSTHSKGSHS